jgi:hypothetical protein
MTAKRNGSRKDVPNMSAVFKEEVWRMLAIDPELTAKKLKWTIETSTEHQGEHKWTKEAYQDLINDFFKTNGRLNPLEKPWAASQFYDNIPPEAIKKIIAIQRLLMNTDHYLTKRRTYFISRLYDVLEPLLKKAYPVTKAHKKYPDNIEIQNLALLQIASFYTLENQRSSHHGRADTHNTLDKIFLVNEDVSFETILLMWVKFYGIFLRAEFKGKTVKYLDKQELSKFIQLIIDNDDGKDAANWIKQRPELCVFALRWMALSTRRDLIDPVKYEIITGSPAENT